jgi:hypothetical protein
LSLTVEVFWALLGAFACFHGVSWVPLGVSLACSSSLRPVIGQSYS